MLAIYVNEIPKAWVQFSYFSLRSLISRWKNILAPLRQLVSCSAELALPTIIWLPGLVKLSSFLTCVV
jgi:uncharacterized membrane protein